MGSAFYTAPFMQVLLADVPWEYMPETTLHTSAMAYDATFMPAAAAYLGLMGEVVDLQVDAYLALGDGAAQAVVALAETKPVAAAAEWYVGAQTHLEERLSPQ
jgi:hypothetical protein